MKKISMIALSTIISLALSPLTFAGVPQTIMKCQSASGHFTISGEPDGEGFDLSIQSDQAIIRYNNTCDDTTCPTKDNYGSLTVVDALFNNVFTISFANSEGNNRGFFYALPNTVHYIKNSRGYTAKYSGIYWGDDPKSTKPYKEFVSGSGVELQCTQENKL
jgi:hypothetical protein